MPVASAGVLKAQSSIANPGTAPYAFGAFTVPDGVTALLNITEQYNQPTREFTIADTGGRTWTLIGTVNTTEARVWVWGWKNTTGASVSPSITVTPPNDTGGFSPRFGSGVVGYTGTADPATTTYPVTNNPTGTGTPAATANQQVTIPVTTVGGLPIVVFANGRGDTPGATLSGSTLVTSEGSGSNLLFHGVYHGTVTASLTPSTVTVGGTGDFVAAKSGLVGIEVMPLAAASTPAGTGFFAVLSRIGLGIATAVVVGGGTVTLPPAITHGDQLTIAATGPWALQGVAKGSEVLTPLTPGSSDNRISTYPGNSLPTWVPTGPYVYNNDPSNLGGIVPAGGMMIDGRMVAAGTIVIQFRDVRAEIILMGDENGTGSPFAGFMARGCRFRQPWGGTSAFPTNGKRPGAPLYLHYCDGGGKSLAQADKCEIPFLYGDTSDTKTTMHMLRCYVSNATTLAFSRGHGGSFVECYGEGVTDFGYGSVYHLNGFGNSGSENATLWLRCNAVIPKASGSVTDLTDVFQMAADFGAYPGTGTNIDGSTGYVIKDCLVGGANYTLQLGLDKANTATDVRNVKVTGNKFSHVYPAGGVGGVSYKNPVWGSYGNDWSTNTWADAPNAGTTIAAPA